MEASAATDPCARGFHAPALASSSESDTRDSRIFRTAISHLADTEHQKKISIIPNYLVGT